MSLLLDTHALLWWLRGDEIDSGAHAAIADPDNLVAVSAVSIWEIAIKESLGKLRVEGGSLFEQLSVSRFESLPITHLHADRAGRLPLHHRDPFDRMLVAQAQIEQLSVVTRDPAFGSYDVGVTRC